MLNYTITNIEFDSLYVFEYFNVPGQNFSIEKSNLLFMFSIKYVTVFPRWLLW